jgi:hypothetical protein
MIVRVASSTNIAWWHRFSAPTGALRVARKARHAYVVIDGTLIPIDRVAADRPFFSGKHRRHGMNLQIIASPAGETCGCPVRCPAAPMT